MVDGGAALQEDLERGVVVVPQRISIGRREFVDDGNVNSYADFYALLRGGGVTSTSTPSPGSYLDAFRRSDAETILCLTIPERWSGMHSTANLAAAMLEAEEGGAGSRSSTPGPPLPGSHWWRGAPRTSPRPRPMPPRGLRQSALPASGSVSMERWRR